MKTQNFGIEIEMTGITRSEAASVIAGHFHSAEVHEGGRIYDIYTVRDEKDRKWKVMRDGSIICEGRDRVRDDSLCAVELVSPVCQYSDIETIQEIVRKLKKAGAKVNPSCGIHVHVDAADHTAQTLKNLVNIVAAKEDLLYKALQVNVRREHYCQKTDVRFLDDVNRKRPKSMCELEAIWYNGKGGRNSHYDQSRYRCLNLHSVFSKGTVEFRLFNSTLHAGKVKAYIQLCLAVSHQALVQKTALRTKTESANEKYTFRTWLLRLGLIGDEFKTARLHLLSHLEGNIAWKDPAQAQKQKERRAAKREQERKSREEMVMEPEWDSEREETEEDQGMTISM